MYASPDVQRTIPRPASVGTPLSLLQARPQPISLYAAGAEIYGQGGKSSGLYQIEFGAVRVYRLLADGRRQICAFYLAGEIFGFEADITHHFFADALVASGVRVLRASGTADLSNELLPLALRSLTRAQEHLLVLGRQSALERIAAFLLDMSDRQGGINPVELPMSRTDIGDYLGLTIETVSRVFSRLKAKRVVRLPTARNVEILKWEILHEMSE
jgi:CRP/FNR family nitrogen fixation transcriptional regulator